MFYPAHPNATDMEGRRIHQASFNHPGKDLDSFQTFKSQHMGGVIKNPVNPVEAAR